MKVRFPCSLITGSIRSSLWSTQCGDGWRAEVWVGGGGLAHPPTPPPQNHHQAWQHSQTWTLLCDKTDVLWHPQPTSFMISSLQPVTGITNVIGSANPQVRPTSLSLWLGADCLWHRSIRHRQGGKASSLYATLRYSELCFNISKSLLSLLCRHPCTHLEI